MELTIITANFDSNSGVGKPAGGVKSQGIWGIHLMSWSALGTIV